MTSHTDYSRYIIASVDQLNPYNDIDKNSHNAYTIGMLAGYLANILAEDPIRYKQFKKHIDSVSKRKSN